MYQERFRVQMQEMQDNRETELCCKVQTEKEVNPAAA